MFKFLKKLKRKAIFNNSATKYLFYALGEIILVIIGILIAVKINNNNEYKKHQEQLKSIYTTIAQDLRMDSIALHNIIGNYESLDSLINIVLDEPQGRISLDTINESNYESCITCGSLHASYLPFKPNQKGYNSLSRFDNNSNQEQDSLTYNIINFYSTKIGELETIIEFISQSVLENVKDLEKYPWYISFSKNEYNKDVIKYFHEDMEYRNKLATYQLLSIGNYLNQLNTYNSEIKELRKEIRKAL